MAKLAKLAKGIGVGVVFFMSYFRPHSIFNGLKGYIKEALLIFRA